MELVGNFLPNKFLSSCFRSYTISAIAILLTACLFLSAAAAPWMVLLGFWGLRFGGQGLMTHTSASTMVRGFEVNRGKALSFSSLGYPASEAVMPLLIAYAIGAVGWRAALQWSAGWLLLVVLPTALWLLRSAPAALKFPRRTIQEGDVEAAKTARNPYRLIRGRLFWLLSPSLFLLAFINTAIFFFQIQLGERRGWDPNWVAGSVSAFALASATGMLLAGPLVDRLTARMVFPFFLLPYFLGLLLLAVWQAPIAYPIALLFLGLSNGMSSPVKNAVLAELYGAQIIGSVRSLFTMAVVFSTALGPVTFGWLIDRGWSYADVLLGSAIAVLLAALWSTRLMGGFTQGRWAAFLRRH